VIPFFIGFSFPQHLHRFPLPTRAGDLCPPSAKGCTRAEKPPPSAPSPGTCVLDSASDCQATWCPARNDRTAALQAGASSSCTRRDGAWISIRSGIRSSGQC
jgi:hypothetical protein